MACVLKNEKILLEWDPDGILLKMINQETGRNMVEPHLSCRVILGHADFLEFEAVPAGECRMETAENRITFSYEKVRGEDKIIYDVPLSLTVTLEGSDVHWGVSVKNATENVTIREIHYPVLAIRDPEPPLKVHTADLVNTTFHDLPGMLRDCFSSYFAPDQKYIRHTAFYPGRSTSMNFFLLDHGKEILYYGCHDSAFFFTGHSFEIEKEKSINCFMTRMPFLAPRQEMKEDLMVTSLISDSWQAGVQKYRQWVNSWFTPAVPPAHVRGSFGWQRVIMHHQYGEYFFRYCDLPRILEAGMPSGIDTVFLFGWTKEGMDAGYPQYTPDPACGGFDSLRENILKVRKKGGHVIIYFNGQLIDAASDYYRNRGGQFVSIKRADGTEHREFYNFSNTGIFTEGFGNKTFVVACPSCREWREILKKHIDEAYALGADGVFFDQLGLASYPCCDPTHGHPVPFTGLMQSKRELCKELYEYAKSLDPDFAIGIECPTDQTAQYSDFIHIFGHTAQVWNPDFRRKGERPLLKSEAPLLCMAFPELYISDREIRDDSNVEFPVNQLVIQQRRSDVEVFRCRGNLSMTPRYREYLKKVNDLRSRFKDILLNGQMTVSDRISCSDQLVIFNSFVKDDLLAVVLTQSSRDSVTAQINAEGYEVIDFASARDDAGLDGNTITLPCDSLAVVLFRKQ